MLNLHLYVSILKNIPIDKNVGDMNLDEGFF